MNRYRVAVIGGGAIAEIFHLPALTQHALSRGNVYVADNNSRRLEDLRSKFDLAGTVEDYRDLAGKVEAVVIATPPQTHYEICKWCLEHGLHVLCEKPLTETTEESETLVELAEQRSLQLVVNQTRRHFPTYQKIRELIAAGELGDIQSIRYHDGIEFDWPAASPHHFSPDAHGTWADTGVHLLDSIVFWLGEEPTFVESFNDSEGGPEAMATVRLRYREAKIEIKVSRLGRLSNDFEICGTEGTIHADAEEWSEVVIERPDGSRQKFRCGSRQQTYTDFAVPMIDDFLASIQKERPSIAAAASVLPTVRLLDQAYRNAKPYSSYADSRANHDWASAISMPSDIRRILVTGASGFLGGRVVEVLHESQLAEPVATLRHWTRAARVARQPTEIRLCDITNAAQVHESMRDIDAVIHCAKTDDRESIVGGTDNLLKAAKAAGVKRFVFISTAEVYGPEVSGQIEESSDTPETGRLYGDAKTEAEALCFRAAKDGLHTTVLRPSLIYGPHSTSWSIDIAKRLQSGNWGLFEGKGEGFANLVYVDDLVQAILRSIASSGFAGEAYNVNGPDEVTWNQYFDQFNETLGLEPLKAISTGKSSLRTWVMDRVGSAADFILDRYEDQLMEIYMRGGWASKWMKRIKGELASTPSGNELNDLYSRKAVYVSGKAERELGYRPAFPLAAGLRQTAVWLHRHELLEQELPWLAGQELSKSPGDLRTEEAVV
ncbi:MAG: NAD-dependent epimerase/dehydratase family protein [Planctomycetota bacterium]